ncbi:hypothetical protein ACH5RR_018279 [Cinchona calisaya]|uniref:Uncharacterized protein n=1 Tax=Cinchona calisaya TaxID=153742 RepID=A0ABD2ZL09_9GENT
MDAYKDVEYEWVLHTFESCQQFGYSLMYCPLKPKAIASWIPKIVAQGKEILVEPVDGAQGANTGIQSKIDKQEELVVSSDKSFTNLHGARKVQDIVSVAKDFPRVDLDSVKLITHIEDQYLLSITQ